MHLWCVYDVRTTPAGGCVCSLVGEGRYCKVLAGLESSRTGCHAGGRGVLSDWSPGPYEAVPADVAQRSRLSAPPVAQQ